MRKIKTYELIKTRQGERYGVAVAEFFAGRNLKKEVREYLIQWLESYNNSIDARKALRGFDGKTFSYDVWVFTLKPVTNSEEG